MPQTRSLKASKSSFFASTRRQISSVFCMTALLISEAGDQVIVHHAGGLHEGIAYGRSDEAEPPLDQRLAHPVRDLGLCRHVAKAAPIIDDRPAIHERPEIRVQAAVFGDRAE